MTTDSSTIDTYQKNCKVEKASHTECIVPAQAQKELWKLEETSGVKNKNNYSVDLLLAALDLFKIQGTLIPYNSMQFSCVKYNPK